MPTDPTLLDYYAGLLIVQYSDRTKAVQTIRLIANQAMCDGLAQQGQTCFDLETAQGKQLDILGGIVGVPRNVYGLDLAHVFFQLNRYNTNSSTYGFRRYNTDETSGYPLFLRYNNDSTYVLTDAELRNLIKLKIILNNTDSSLKSIMALFWKFFPNQITVIDNRDMTITYQVSSNLSNALAAAIFLQILPKPMGVSATVTYV